MSGVGGRAKAQSLRQILSFMYALCTPQSGICTQALHFIAPIAAQGVALLMILVVDG